MTTKEFIEKAIEGGYEWTDKPLPYPLELKLKVFRASFKGAAQERITLRAMLSAEAWKAVGKVEGWEDTDDVQLWKSAMVSMVLHLADGGTIESYLETL